MPKFYVDLVRHRCVCDAETPTAAAVKAIFNSGKRVEVGRLIKVNEQGFRTRKHKSDVYIHTKKVLAELSGFPDDKDKEES